MQAGTNHRSQEIARLFWRYNRVLVKQLRMRLGSEEDAQDVAQDAYVRMLQLDADATISHAASYLFQVARNIATDRLRTLRRSQHARLLEENTEQDWSDEPERTAIAAEQLALVDAALAELPDRCRNALLMYRYEEMRQRCIATELGVSERMVRSYLTQATDHCFRSLGTTTHLYGIS